MTTPVVTLADFLLARTCSIPGCERGGKLTRGMCGKHYRYWLDHTPPEERPTAPRFAREFDDFIDRSGGESGCWMWTGPKNRKGYGLWSGGGQRGLAHRLSLLRQMPCPDRTLFACHRCDTPGCVNPRHLYWGTIRDNTDDMLARQGVHNAGKFAVVCKRGHRIDGENLRIYGAKQRRACRECDNRRARDHQRRYREARRGIAQ